MKNLFAAEYALHLELLNNYKAAQAANDEAAMQEARAAHNQQDERLLKMGQMHYQLFDEYRDAMERGNAYISWDAVIWDRDVEAFVRALRDCGIEKFVFSSKWSSAVETAWLIQKNGCKLEGLVEINGVSKRFGSDEYEKIHGYLFSI